MAETQASSGVDTAERRAPVVMFNIPEPNPLRGNNILIEMNGAAARLLCDTLDDIDLNRPEDRPLVAFKKQIRQYYGAIKEHRRAREAASLQVEPVAQTV